MHDNNKNDDLKSQYTKEEMKNIYLHRIILFIIFFIVLVAFAMKDLTNMFPIVSFIVSTGLALTLSYFMSFTVHDYAKKNGFIVYAIILAVILLIVFRNS